MSIKRAVEELESIIDSQWKNGMLPHIRFVKGEEGYSPDANEWGAFGQTKKDTFETSGITQPPVMGMALEKICNHKEAKAYLNQIIAIAQGTEEFHDFLFECRDMENESLVCIVHPWESGLDNSPIYDLPNENAKEQLDSMNIKQQILKRKDINRVIAEFRPGEKDYDVYGKLMGYYKQVEYDQKNMARHCPFRVQDLLYNLLLYRSMLSLQSVYSFLQKATSSSEFHSLHEKNRLKANALKEAMFEKLYDKEQEAFYSYDLNGKMLLKINTIQSLMAKLFFSSSEKEAQQAIEAYQESHEVHFMSTSDKEKSCFDALKYWRGPVWPVTNWLICEHLQKAYPKLAEPYVQESLDLIAEGIDAKTTRETAMKLMYFNLVYERFTTPSKNQYKHGWLWDSVFAAIGWLYVDEEVDTLVYKEVMVFKQEAIKEGKALYEIREAIKEKFHIPLFDEYYVAKATSKYPLKAPIGSEMMTWTAAVYLDLYEHVKKSE